MQSSKMWTTTYPFKDRDVHIQADEDGVRAEFRDSRYTVAKLLQNPVAAKGEYFYRANYKCVSENVTGYLYYIWRNDAGKELAKGYLHAGDRFTSPADAATLTIEVLLTGKGIGSFRLTDLKIEEEGPYCPRNVRVCAIGYELLNRELVTLPFEENVALTLREIDAVAHEKPDVVVLTEAAFQTSEKIPAGCSATPNRLGDVHVKALCAKAREYGCYIVTSLRTIDEDDVLHNTCILIDREGNIQGTAHKTHLTIGEKERGMELGTELPVFDTDFGRIGMLVCWEHFFPEAVRTLALKGAELLLVPTHGFRLDRAAVRAMENGIYLATAHVRGADSVILDQDGQVIADGREKGYAVAELDLNQKAMVQYLSSSSWSEPNNIYLSERHPAIYHSLCEQT